MTADWYRRAADELAGTSARQSSWAAGVAADPELPQLIERLPRERRQPSLIFSVAAWLGAPDAEYPVWRAWVLAHWPEIEAAARTRTTQTNEPGRCAALVAALAGIPGPLALLELGASAGLCLVPDRYRYVFDDGPALGDPDARPLLRCVTTGDGPVVDALPTIVWRRGVDLTPLAVDDAADRAWLSALLPPDRPERRIRLHEALDTVAALDPADRPQLVAGDARAELRAQAQQAPVDATLVIVALGTLVYLPPADRAGVLAEAAALGARLVTLEPVTALPEVAARIAGRTAPEPTPFLLALDGHPIAYVSPHGDRLSWLGPARQPGEPVPQP